MEPTALRGELASLGWSPEQLIARVNQRRTQRGSVPLHRKTAYPWVRGRRPCTEASIDVLAVLSHYTGRPLTAADLHWDGPRERRTRSNARVATSN